MVTSKYTLSKLDTAIKSGKVEYINGLIHKHYEVESTLQREVANHLLHIYQHILGINIKYKVELTYIDTYCEVLELVKPGVYGDLFSNTREILQDSLILDCEWYRDILEYYGNRIDKLELNVRDDKFDNFFIWDNKYYLLDLADFYLVGLKNGVCINLLKDKHERIEEYHAPKVDDIGRYNRYNNYKYTFTYM